MFKSALHFFLVASIAAGQQGSDSRVKVLTVCEVLDDLDRYADTNIAIVGRMLYSVSVIDHYEFLSQDHCKRAVITHGHVWSNEIQVWTFLEPGMPRPPGDKPELAQAEITAKLTEVRKTTKLGTHTEPGLDARGRPNAASMPNNWAVVYGRLVRSPRLNEDCGPSGCGGRNVPLIVLAQPDQVHILSTAGSPIIKEN